MSDRAINTVADVSLAIVVVTAAIALLATAPGSEQPADDYDADRTAEVVSTATLAVPYSLAPVVSDMDLDSVDDNTDLRRHSHGSVANLLADAAVSNLTVSGSSSHRRLTPMGEAYESAIEGRFQARFVGSNFETNVTALWEPYEGNELRGTATVGEPIPPEREYSSVHLTVPSGFESVQNEALAAVEHDSDFPAVGRRVAEHLVRGYLPPLEAKRALESSGFERERTVYRYEQMASLVEGADPDDRELRRNLERDSAEPFRINRYLVTHLAEQIADDLQSSYDSAATAAEAVSTGEVTIIVRTWNHE